MHSPTSLTTTGSHRHTHSGLNHEPDERHIYSVNTWARVIADCVCVFVYYHASCYSVHKSKDDSADVLEFDSLKILCFRRRALTFSAFKRTFFTTEGSTLTRWVEKHQWQTCMRYKIQPRPFNHVRCKSVAASVTPMTGS